MDPRVDPTTPEVDPLVIDTVNRVRDRFGAEGLRDLIALATSELGRVEKAERELARLNAERAPSTEPPLLDSADTQAWLAYTEAEPSADDDIR